MHRYRLRIEYDGSPFVGWQRQENGPSVQQALEEAVFRFSGETVRIQGAGRTDAGVHATGQAAHLDLARDWAAEKLREALNAQLRPAPIAVLAAERVDAGFDARGSAVKRHYLYRIANRRAPLTLDANRAWLVKGRLDGAAMAEAARILVGRHDFSTFRSVQCQAASPVKTLDRLDVEAVGDELHVIASARSFLHHQVRSMVGSLQWVGAGRWRAQDLAEALDARDRRRCGPMAPACGLYLTRVDYG